MTLGCTVPWAKNYNPGADTDDGSCIYLQKVGNVCYQFSDLPASSILNRGFTLSYALTRGWSFYHDYNPDFYFHTRRRFMCLSGGKGYYLNEGVRGKYLTGTVHPFFIDMVFAGLPALKMANQMRYTTVQEPLPAMTLDAINWVSEVRNTGNNVDMDDQPALYNETITAITIWNNYQTSGRILLDPAKTALERTNNRNSELKWTMSGFRDIVKTQGVNFLLDIFADYAIDPANTLTTQPWFRQKLIEGKYFIVRFEFDNNNNKQITLHDLDVDVSKSYR